MRIRSRPFWSGALVGMLATLSGGVMLISRGVFVSRLEMMQMVSQVGQKVVSEHRQQILGLAHSALEPMVQQQVLQLSRSVYVSVEGQHFPLPRVDRSTLGSLLTRQAERWATTDLAHILNSPKIYMRPLARFTIKALNQRKLALHVGPLTVPVPIRVSK